MDNTNTTGWTDAILIREIRAGGQRRNRAWEYIYKAWRGYYLAPVLRAGGKPEQVDEVLGEVIMDLEKQILKEDFELKVASLRTYFITGIIRAWSRAREGGQRRQTDDLDSTYVGGQRDSVEEDFIRQERMQRLDTLLTKLGEKCRTILTRFALGYSMQEIAVELGMQEQSVKNDKLKCQRKLLEITDDL